MTSHAPSRAPATVDVGATRSLAANASLLAVANTAAGGLNYLFGLSLSYVLPKSQYVVAVAGNGLLVIVGTAAMSSASWALAHKLASPRGDDGTRDHEIISAGIALAVVQGVVLALLTVVPSAQFGTPLEVVAIAVSALVATVGVVAKGVMQGLDRFALLSVIILGEVVVKVAAGLGLVALGGGAAGALTGTAAGASVLVVIALASVGPRGLRFCRATLVSMWKTSMGMAVVQGLVAVVMAADLLVAAVLDGSDGSAATYQLAAVIGRSPTFLAAAVAAVFFPAIARSPKDLVLRAESASLMLRLVLPVAAVLATIPAPILTVVLPPGYSSVYSYLPLTAATGLLFAGITLVASWLCAAERYGKGAALLAAGAAVDGLALLVGSRLGGLTGVAAAAVAGAGVVLLLALPGQRKEVAIRPGTVLLPLLFVAPLALCRTASVLWCLVAAAALAAGAVGTIQAARTREVLR